MVSVEDPRARTVPGEYPYLVGWVGMIGTIMVLHFGSFHLLSCWWRSRGVRALWLATAGFHRGAYRYYRKHIDPRRFGAVQLVVVAGLTARTLVVFVSRSLKSVWSRRVAFDSASLRAM